MMMDCFTPLSKKDLVNAKKHQDLDFIDEDAFIEEESEEQESDSNEEFGEESEKELDSFGNSNNISNSNNQNNSNNNLKNGLIESTKLFNVYKFEKNMCDGGGLVLNRLIGTQEMDILNPFILLDEIDSSSPEEYSYGFPDHPHRGLQLVTYMLEGEMAHTDSLGNNETLLEGDLQWILAGKGIYHSEMPVIKNEDNRLWVIHYWVNLPRQFKMINPDYQHIHSSKVPQIKYEIGNSSFDIKVVSGQYENYKSPLNSIGVLPNVYDIKMNYLSPSPSSSSSLSSASEEYSYPISINLPGNSNSFILVLSGSVSINQSKLIEQGHFIVFNNTKNIKKFKESDEYDKDEFNQEDHTIEISSNNNFRIMYFSAEILNEPIVKFGPFAMNSITEIHQCFIDFKGV